MDYTSKKTKPNVVDYIKNKFPGALAKSRIGVANYSSGARTVKDQTVLRLYFEVLPRKCAGLAQYYAIGLILMRTIWSDAYPQPEWAMVTAVKFGAASSMSPRGFDFALTDAAKRGLVEKQLVGRNCIYKALPNNWEAAPDYQRAKRGRVRKHRAPKPVAA